MVEIFKYDIASDDLLWVIDGITWRDDAKGEKLVLDDLIRSPTKFLNGTNVTVNPRGSKSPINPIVRSPFVMIFKPTIGAMKGPFCVQGIHETSFLTVASPRSFTQMSLMKMMEDGIDEPEPCPIPGVIQATVELVLGVDGMYSPRRSFIHWEVPEKNDRSDHYDQTAKHVKRVLTNCHSITATYNTRLVPRDDGTYCNATIRFVTGDGGEIWNSDKDHSKEPPKIKGMTTGHPKFFVRFSDDEPRARGPLDIDVDTDPDASSDMDADAVKKPRQRIFQGDDPEQFFSRPGCLTKLFGIFGGHNSGKFRPLDGPGGTPGTSCNSDNGDATYNPNTGHYEVVINQTVVKIY